MLLGTLTQRSGAIKYCPPKDGLSVVQARLIVEKYMGEHPEDLHLEAGLSAAQALWDAFPCGAKSN
jgi:hypothetical protein